MCRKEIDIEPFPLGRLQADYARTKTLFLTLIAVILVALPSGKAQDSHIPDIHRIISGGRIHRVDRSDQYERKTKHKWKEEDLFVGHSGDPWGSASATQPKDNVYVRVSSLNATYNDTGSEQLRYEKNSLARTRFKRGVVHLYNMVVCATGCNPLAYKGYGCYCGFLGSGYVIDGIDRCCKMHDWCYDATECPMFSEYFVPYYWRCYEGYKPICAVEHGDWGGSGSCAQRLCECDRSLAECLRRYPCPTTKAVCTSSPWRLVQNLFMIM
ncbi:hypothetical protein KM043_013789 [Ampulex compressa]|nr:hypothetical protein KM043_013789 [Ampulex compressa]